MSILSIVKTDFVGEIALSGATPNIKLDYAIDQYELEILIKLLGKKLYDDFKAGLEEEIILEKWTNLRDGEAFEYNDIEISFDGVKKMTLYYIYSQHILNDLENTPLGSGQIKSKNRAEVSRRALQNESERVYKKFLNHYKIAQIYIRENITDYTGFTTTIL